MDKKRMIEKIKDRYFRSVISRKQGHVVHFGDCGIYSSDRICTCGLILDLMPSASLLNKFMQGTPTFQRRICRTSESEEDAEDWKLIEEVFGREYAEFLQHKD
jgi:hypothetical protein